MIPVHIVSGFLGVGKTTFLNHWIAQRAEEKIAVIENEMGEIGIDGQLLISTENHSIFELNDGCLCCTLNEDLYKLLEELIERQEDFDRLIIETTGIADPSAVALAFLSDGYIRHHFDLQNILILADASNVEQRLGQAKEVQKQLAFADAILLNKIDTISAEKQAELQTVLQGINPFAQIFSAEQGKFPITELLQIKGLEKAYTEQQSKHIHAHSHHHAHSDIVAHSFVLDAPMDLDQLSYRLTVMLNIQANHFYRIKGVLYVKGVPQRIILQSIGNMQGFSEGSDWEKGEKKQSKIVFIGHQIQRESLEKILKQCTAS